MMVGGGFPATSEATLIGHRDLQNLKPNATIWDTGKGSVTGFGARRRVGDVVSFVVVYRCNGRKRWLTIGRYGALQPDEARALARKALVAVAGGHDPAADKQAARAALTVSELCDQYLAAARSGDLLTKGRPKRASTLKIDGYRIERHIKPLLGKKPVAAVTDADIKAFRRAVESGKTQPRDLQPGERMTSRRIMGMLGAIFEYARKEKMRPDNPCRGVERGVDGARERRLTPEEYARLGAALRDMPHAWPPAVAAARMIALTGWRRGEVLNLKWAEVDLAARMARLGETKTGRSTRPLSNRACDVLRGLPRLAPGELVFPSAKTDGVMRGFAEFWKRVAAKAELPRDVTPHVLRHSFASEAASLELSELTIATLLGHRKASITSKYIHMDATILRAADRVADEIARAIGDGAALSGEVVPIRVVPQV